MRRLIFATAIGVATLAGAYATGVSAAPGASAASNASVQADVAADTPAAGGATIAPPNDDPWESTNRKFYGFNQGLDRAIIRPAAMGYQRGLPKTLRLGIRNILSNLDEPNNIINDILQIRLVPAVRSTGRFVMNSTVGIAGLFDVATPAGLTHHDNSFNLTLGRYGAKSGPYVYLPVLGPSTVRGLIGYGVDSLLDPLYWIRYPDKTAASVSRAVVGGLDKRAEYDGTLKSLTADATDPYATLRSAYLQNQQSQVSGEATTVQALPDFDEPTATKTHPKTPPAPRAAPAPDQAAPPASASPPSPSPNSAP